MFPVAVPRDLGAMVSPFPTACSAEAGRAKAALFSAFAETSARSFAISKLSKEPDAASVRGSPSERPARSRNLEADSGRRPFQNANRADDRVKPFRGATAASDNVGADGARLATQN